MKKLFFLLVVVSTFYACANNNQNNDSSKKDSEAVNPLNPNGDSELAIVMRDMETHWKTTKKNLEDGKTIGKLPSFGKLLTAVPTDESMKDEYYDGFAKAYLSQINALGQAKPDAQKQAYNVVVNACITCHENSCSGPIPRIKKLLIRE